MIDGRTLAPGTPIYSFVAHDGENINIHASALREHCLAVRPEVVWTPVSREKAREFLLHNAVDPARVIGLTLKHLRDPIMYCKSGEFTHGAPDVFLVDGHHRYVRTAIDGYPIMAAWLLERAFWLPFSIINLREITQEELRARPVTKRNY